MVRPEKRFGLRKTSRILSSRFGPTRLIAASGFTPMLDVMFNLLIFFLVATSFSPPEGLLSSTLPAIEEGVSTGVPVVPIKVFVFPDTFSVSSSLVDDISRMQIATNIETLEVILKKGREDNLLSLDRPVIIAAKDNIRWERIVDAYNLLIKLGFSSITFAEY